MNASVLKSPLTPSKLTDKRLGIPIYQRLFVWDEEQIDKLFQDLCNACKVPETPYHIGIVTVVEKYGNRWEVVDGQQRLTFLTLFGAECIRNNVCKDSWGKFVFCDDVNKTLRISYSGRPEDEEDIKTLAENVNPPAVLELQNPNISKFHECFEKWRKKLGDEFAGFSKYVHTQTSFLISELPTTYSPLDLNKFFEKMNAAGRQLDPEDVVKAKHFSSHALTWNRCMDFSKVYKPDDENGSDQSVEFKFDDIFKDTAPEVGSEPSPESDAERFSTRLILKPAVFLLHVLKLSFPPGSKVSLEPNKLIETFKGVFDRAKDQESLKGTFIEKMESYRTWLDNNIIYLRNGEGQQADEYAFRADTDNSEPETEKGKQKLKQFQSMLYVSSDEKQEWVRKAYRKKEEGQDLLEALKAQDKARQGGVPKLGDMSYPTINRYWFWRLDYELWEKHFELLEKNPEWKKTPPDEIKLRIGCGGEEPVEVNLGKEESAAISNFRFQRNRSIEHLHPQASTTWLEAEDLNGFGNLAMISASFNSAQSNDTLATKFGRVKDQVSLCRLQSIKMLLMFKAADGTETGWTSVCAKNHGEKMHSLLCETMEGTGGENPMNEEEDSD